MGLISDVATTVATITRYVDTDVVLTCPMLMPGTKYQLAFKKDPEFPEKILWYLPIFQQIKLFTSRNLKHSKNSVFLYIIGTSKNPDLSPWAS